MCKAYYAQLDTPASISEQVTRACLYLYNIPIYMIPRSRPLYIHTYNIRLRNCVNTPMILYVYITAVLVAVSTARASVYNNIITHRADVICVHRKLYGGVVLSLSPFLFPAASLHTALVSLISYLSFSLAPKKGIDFLGDTIVSVYISVRAKR